MVAYILVFLLSPLILLAGKKRHRTTCEIQHIHNKEIYRNHQKVFIILSLLLMIVIAVLRSNVGPDYDDYVNMYKSYRQVGLIAFTLGAEPGYVLVCLLCGIISESAVLHFAVFSIATYCLVYRWILRNTEISAFALFLFLAFGYYLSAYMGIRQWLAAAILFNSYEFLKEGNIKKAVVAVVAATMFHYSAIVAIFVFLFAHKPRRKMTQISLMAGCTIVYFSYGFVLTALSRIISFVTIWIPKAYQYQRYLNTEWMLDSNVLANPLFCLITFAAISIYEKRMRKRDEHIGIYTNLVAVAYGISIVGQKLYIFNRLQIYFVPMIVIMLTKVAETMKVEDRKIFVLLCLALGSAFFVYLLSTGAMGAIPYRTIFTEGW